MEQGRQLTLREMFIQYDKRDITETERNQLDELYKSLKYQSEHARTELRKRDLYSQADGIRTFLRLVDHIGGIPQKQEIKRTFMSKAIEEIGGWPHHLSQEGTTIHDWTGRYNRYLGYTEASSILGWKDDEWDWTPNAVFNYLNGITQRVSLVPLNTLNQNHQSEASLDSPNSPHL